MSGWDRLSRSIEDDMARTEILADLLSILSERPITPDVVLDLTRRIPLADIAHRADEVAAAIRRAWP